MRGYILLLLGVVLFVLAAAQHVMQLITVSHLAIYLSIAGLVALLPGLWLTLRTGARS
jgi:hypothetical protein